MYFMKTVEGRRLCYAGRAPAGPEMRNDDFSPQIGQVAGLTGEVESKIFRARSSNGGFSLAIAGHGEGDDQG